MEHARHRMDDSAAIVRLHLSCWSAVPSLKTPQSLVQDQSIGSQQPDQVWWALSSCWQDQLWTSQGTDGPLHTVLCQSLVGTHLISSMQEPSSVCEGFGVISSLQPCYYPQHQWLWGNESGFTWISTEIYLAAVLDTWCLWPVKQIDLKCK